MKKIILAVLFVLAITQTVQAQESNREAHKWGGYISILGDPSPSIFGLNVGYNLNSMLRVHAGYGEVKVSDIFTGVETSMTSIGAGIDAFWPEWNFTPVVGLSYTHVAVDGDGFDVAASNITAKIGFDWTTKGGYMLGAGIQVALSGDGDGPYVQTGWFF